MRARSSVQQAVVEIDDAADELRLEDPDAAVIEEVDALGSPSSEKTV